MPTRDELDRHERAPLQLGGRTKADLRVVDLGQGPLVVKDFRRKAWWVRQIGRLQISRECRAYGWLRDQPGVPRFVGRVDAHALALERIDGQQLTDARWPGRDGAILYARLEAAVRRMHRAGLAHLDLRGRENVLLGADGRVYIVDLASAVWFRPRSVARRLLFPWFKLTDEAALLKWKRLLQVPYTEKDRAFLRRHRFWRALWIFNRKRRSRRPESGR